LILAGDIHTGSKAVPFIKELSTRFAHVIYILGNHEYYYTIYSDNIEDIRNELSSIPNVHFLEKESILIDNVRFFGGTFWTDMANGSPLFSIQMKRADFTDFRVIRRYHNQTGKSVKFDTVSGYYEFLDTMKVFKPFLEEEFNGRTV